MRRRDPTHYLNLNPRLTTLEGSLNLNHQALCLNLHLFGVIGTLENVDSRTGSVKIHIDRQEEEQKIHDPFIGHTVLLNKGGMFVKKESIKKYMTDEVIEKKLRLKFGIVNRITGSVLVSYTDRETYERQVIDIGLNLKNFTKKVHIPDYVRYVSSEDVADNQHDSY